MLPVPGLLLPSMCPKMFHCLIRSRLQTPHGFLGSAYANAAIAFHIEQSNLLFPIKLSPIHVTLQPQHGFSGTLPMPMPLPHILHPPGMIPIQWIYHMHRACPLPALMCAQMILSLSHLMQLFPNQFKKRMNMSYPNYASQHRFHSLLHETNPTRRGHIRPVAAAVLVLAPKPLKGPMLVEAAPQSQSYLHTNSPRQILCFH